VRERASEGESEIGRREKRESARSRERECVREKGERESEGERWSEQHLTIPHAHQRLCKVMSPRLFLSEGGTRGEGKWDVCVGGEHTLKVGALAAARAFEDTVFPPVQEITEVSSLHDLGRSTVRVAEVAQRDIIHVRPRPKLADNACK
jgi:hypothetical protein